MEKTSRFRLHEITIHRMMEAARSRLLEIPHAISWKFSTYAQLNKSRIQQFQNIHVNERCFIVANGPSLNKTDLRLIENEISFGVNRIYLNFSSSSFRPTYYVAVNELVLQQFSNEITNLPMPKFLNWNQRKCFDKSITNLVYLKTKLVISDSFQKDLTHSMVFGATVTFVALQLAFYMGFKKVILVGLDHNFTDKGTPNTTELRKTDLDLSHFDKQYFPKGTKWQLPDLTRSDLDYGIARKIFEQNGREIVDATIDGKCTIFPKVEYSSLFSRLG